jgi:hypothetical protein
VIFREVRGTFGIEGDQIDKETKKLVFELKNEEHDQTS